MVPTPTGWNIDLSQVSKGIVIMSRLSAFKHDVKVSTETNRYDSIIVICRHVSRPGIQLSSFCPPHQGGALTSVWNTTKVPLHVGYNTPSHTECACATENSIIFCSGSVRKKMENCEF